VVWQHKLPSVDFGAATVANDVVFTSTYAGTIYACDAQTGKTLWTTKAPAGINSFPAIDGDTLLVGAGTTGFHRNRKFELIAYSLPRRTHNHQGECPMGQLTVRSVAVLAAVAVAALSVVQFASARTEPQAQASATTIQVGAKEFSFKLSAKSIARPGNVTFAVKSNGHEAHDFSINGKQTKLLQPGKTAKLAVSFKKAGRYRYLCTVPGHAAMGMRCVFTVR
jgi:plastocyanin